MESIPEPTRTQRRYPRRSTAKRNLFAKRLRFLLRGLKIIDAFGPPAERLVIALIQECIAQIWPEPQRASTVPAHGRQRCSTALSLPARAPNARTLWTW